MGSRTWATRAQTSGSWSRTQTSFGAVKPVSASLPVIATSRSGPTSSRISVALGAGPLVVPEDRRPEDLVRRVEQDGAVHLAGEADRCDVVAGDAGLGQDGRGSPSTVPSHQRCGSCSLQSGRGTLRS